MRTSEARLAYSSQVLRIALILGSMVLISFAATADAAADIWVSHVCFDHGWRTSFAVYYSGTESSAKFTVSRFTDGGGLRGSPATFGAKQNKWTSVPEKLLAYSGSARVQSNQSLQLKATYRHGPTGRAVELLLSGDARQDWVLYNSRSPDYDRSGVALVNSSDARATVTLEARRGGQKVGVRSVSLTPYARYAKYCDEIWSGLSYRDFDKVTIRASVQFAQPAWIVDNLNHDRRLISAAMPLSTTNLAIVNGTLIDGTGRPVVPDAAVLIESGIITAAGRRGELKIPRGTPTIDVGGGYILPGFINAHVHNAFNRVNLSQWASEGVTSVRDVGARHPDSALILRDGVRFTPSYSRLLTAGPLVTVPGGYPLDTFPALTVTSPEDARAKISGLIDQGVDLIKITLEPGGGALPTLTREEVEAIVDTAHKRRIPVTAHVTRADMLQLAVDSGVDFIEHIPLDRIEDSLIDRMVRAGTIVVPTLTALGNYGQSVENLRRFHAAGGRAAMGNDGGYLAGLEIGMPISELLAMQAAGMSPMQVIVSATKMAAEICRLGRMLGTIETGKQADILVVKDDPLRDLNNLLDVGWVIHGGEVIVP
ncbi:MAG: amidohydrolase family protein [Acidobacteriota bacterium]